MKLPQAELAVIGCGAEGELGAAGFLAGYGSGLQLVAGSGENYLSLPVCYCYYLTVRIHHHFDGIGADRISLHIYPLG